MAEHIIDSHLEDHAKEYVADTLPSHSPTPPAPIIFAETTKPWWVWIRSITSNAEGMIHGVGSDSKVYIWHHSFIHSGKWVLHVTGR